MTDALPVASHAERIALEFEALMRGLRELQHASETCGRAWFDLDLTMAQFRALMAIARSNSISGRQLAEQLRISPSAVTPLVDRLVQQGYVRREADVVDRRVVWVRPTERGQEIFRQVHAAAKDPFDRVLAELSPEELDLVGRALAVLRAAVDRTCGTSPPSAPAVLRRSHNNEILAARPEPERGERG